MIDQFGRIIDYLRVSITDHCNLRCAYCVPRDTLPSKHDNTFSIEELLRLCRIAITLGIVKFKVTGGEPLLRTDCVDFITRLKAEPGVKQVTVTTNGLLLNDHLDALCAAGIDGINISLNTLRDTDYRALTGFPCVSAVILALEQCVRRNINVKVNAVLLAQTFDGIGELALLARDMPVDVRFIELMPLGAGSSPAGVPAQAALERLREWLPDLHPVNEKHGNGPARYYAAEGLRGRIGFIGALSDPFCVNCNRIRLTSAGILKPCLCYNDGIDITSLLRGGASDETIGACMRECAARKPRSHSFTNPRDITEREAMNRIGG